MGIHPDYPGLTAVVLVNGGVAEEYAYDEAEPSRETVTKFVEAISGASLAIKYVVPAAFFTNLSVNYTLQIDGEIVCDSI